MKILQFLNLLVYLQLITQLIDGAIDDKSSALNIWKNWLAKYRPMYGKKSRYYQPHTVYNNLLKIQKLEDSLGKVVGRLSWKDMTFAIRGDGTGLRYVKLGENIIMEGLMSFLNKSLSTSGRIAKLFVPEYSGCHDIDQVIYSTVCDLLDEKSAVGKVLRYYELEADNHCWHRYNSSLRSVLSILGDEQIESMKKIAKSVPQSEIFKEEEDIEVFKFRLLLGLTQYLVNYSGHPEILSLNLLASKTVRTLDIITDEVFELCANVCHLGKSHVKHFEEYMIYSNADHPIEYLEEVKVACMINESESFLRYHFDVNQ